MSYAVVSQHRLARLLPDLFRVSTGRVHCAVSILVGRRCHETVCAPQGRLACVRGDSTSLQRAGKVGSAVCSMSQCYFCICKLTQVEWMWPAEPTCGDEHFRILEP